MSASIPETVSRTRGRPRVLDGDGMAALRALFPDVKTPRGLQNVAYRGRAVRLVDEAASGRPALRWLIDPTCNRIECTLLNELGRISDDALLLCVAEWLCDTKPPVRAGLAAIRRVRLHGRPRQAGSATRLAAELTARIGDYLGRHPDTTDDVLEAALGLVARCRIRPALDGAA